ncbi:unnamed protein product, partial [Rotaria sp. Silwood2]
VRFCSMRNIDVFFWIDDPQSIGGPNSMIASSFSSILTVDSAYHLDL